MHVRFRVLGSLEVWSGDQRIPVVGVRHQRVLAMLLLAANRVVSLDRLVEAAWDDEPPATAARQVRKTVANLRQRLPGGPDLIVTEDPGYRMVLATEQLDLSQFDEGIARAKRLNPADAVVELRAALALWRGPVMVDNGGQIIQAVATVLAERRLNVTERLLELRLSLGEAREVVDELRGLVSEHPMRESLRGMLMLALYRTGRQAEALAEYDRLRKHLSDELGIDPGRHLSTVYERILRSSPELDAPATGQAAVATGPAPRSIPHDLPDFVGRSPELARLMEIVDEPAEHLLKIVTINGMAGSGKTAFAVHAAHQLAARYPDGQMFVDLHGFAVGRRPVEPAEALDALLTGVGVPFDRIPGTVEGRISLWRTVAAQRRTLIVLDNAVDSAQVQPLLPGMCCCLVLVTSRSYLAGLDGAVPLSLDLLTEDDALQLLAGTLGGTRLDSEREAALDLVRSCGRLPLALRIAAARLRNHPQRDIRYLTDRLRDAHGRLGELVAENRSVAATIGLSYEALKPEPGDLFRLLGTLPGCGFDAYIAAAVTGRPLAEAEELMEELLDAHLLVLTGGTHYAFHDLVRDYAQSLVDTDGAGAPQARQRVLDYYVLVAGVAAGFLRRAVVPPPTGATEIPPVADAAAALDWFDAERANVMATVAAADQDGREWDARQLAGHLAVYLELRGHYEQELEILRAAAPGLLAHA